MMDAPRLMHHGENIRPEYAHKGGKRSAAGVSTDSARSDSKVSGTVTRYKKGRNASEVVTSLGLIKTIHSAAIEYHGIPAHIRGLAMLSAFTTACACVAVGAKLINDLLGPGPPLTTDKFVGPIGIAFIIFGLAALLFGIRHEFFRPMDEPVIFDRANKKVYRLFRESQPGIKGILRRWPIRAVEYDWSLIDVEHIATVAVNTEIAHRHHSLLFIVRKSKSDPTIIDSFVVVHGIQLGEASVGPVWEHIRRFMEEDGPHLPPDESLYQEAAPNTLWQSIGMVGPIGPKYISWWKEHAVFTAFLHVAAPFVVPIFLFWGLFNWLSYKTAIQTHWPKEVIEAIMP